MILLYYEHTISNTVKKCMVLTCTIFIHYGLYFIRGTLEGCHFFHYQKVPVPWPGCDVWTLRFAGGRGSTLAHVSKAPSGDILPVLVGWFLRFGESSNHGFPSWLGGGFEFSTLFCSETTLQSGLTSLFLGLNFLTNLVHGTFVASSLGPLSLKIPKGGEELKLDGLWETIPR